MFKDVRYLLFGTFTHFSEGYTINFVHDRFCPICTWENGQSEYASFLLFEGSEILDLSKFYLFSPCRSVCG